jgi:hypothetical protein
VTHDSAKRATERKKISGLLHSSKSQSLVLVEVTQVSSASKIALYSSEIRHSHTTRRQTYILIPSIHFLASSTPSSTFSAFVP